VALPGYTAWFEFKPHWAFSAKCDPVTDTCDAGLSGYTPTGNETILDYENGTQSGVYITSTGRLPNGLLARHGFTQATYHLCDIVDRTFSLRRGWRGTVNVNGTQVIRVSGPDFIGNLEPGRAVTINGNSYTVSTILSATQLILSSPAGTINSAPIDSACAGAKQTFTDPGDGIVHILHDPDGPNYYVRSVTGLPDGATLSWLLLGSGGPTTSLFFDGTNHFFYKGRSQATLGINIPAAGVNPGKYRVTVTLNTRPNGSGEEAVSSFEVEVVAFEPVTQGTPVAYPPIPALAAWEEAMTTSMHGGGAFWCDKTTGITNPATLSFGVETQIWYYDGARVFHQIADYTGDPEWNNCRDQIANQYRSYVVAGQGSVPGYRRFPHGLALMYQATGDTEYRDAVDMLCSTNYAEAGGRTIGKLIRETSYVLDCYVVKERDLGEARSPKMVRTAEFLMGALLSNSNGGYRSMEQQFFNGLAYAALIGYFELTGDARVPWVLERSLAHAWSNYNQTAHAMPYSPDPEGPYCHSTAVVKMWFILEGGGICGQAGATIGQRVLNLLYAHAWAWMWQHTGNDLYREQGDELFQYALQDGDNGRPFSGKEFSQVYRSGFNYVRWRGMP
jgi:hypothetical protein